jgi:hypothetical protein
MKIFAALFLISSVTAATAVAAKGPSQAQQSQVTNELRRGLQAMVQSQTEPPGQSTRPVDPDQGDDNAAARAIQMVCNRDKRAASRSAICPPISPE